MSIRDEIRARIEEGQLFHLQPYLPGSLNERTMLVSESIHRAVTPPWDGISDEHRLSQLRADLDTFTEGKILSVSNAPYVKAKSTYLARTDPISDEVWDIRSRDPKPGLRVLGCFAAQDVFVALEYDCRDSLGGPGSKEWRDFIERAKAKWRHLFLTYQPHSGGSIDEYISTHTHNVAPKS
jgi:hypothetical protein